MNATPAGGDERLRLARQVRAIFIGSVLLMAVGVGGIDRCVEDQWCYALELWTAFSIAFALGLAGFIGALAIRAGKDWGKPLAIALEAAGVAACATLAAGTLVLAGLFVYNLHRASGGEMSVEGLFMVLLFIIISLPLPVIGWLLVQQAWRIVGAIRFLRSVKLEGSLV